MGWPSRLPSYLQESHCGCSTYRLYLTRFNIPISLWASLTHDAGSLHGQHAGPTANNCMKTRDLSSSSFTLNSFNQKPKEGINRLEARSNGMRLQYDRISVVQLRRDSYNGILVIPLVYLSHGVGSFELAESVFNATFDPIYPHPPGALFITTLSQFTS